MTTERTWERRSDWSRSSIVVRVNARGVHVDIKGQTGSVYLSGAELDWLLATVQEAQAQEVCKGHEFSERCIHCGIDAVEAFHG